MSTFNVHEAKTHLSRLLVKVEAGEKIVIARSGKPVARLVGYRHGRPVRRFGALKGRLTVDDSFFDPLPEAELEAWESADESTRAPKAARRRAGKARLRGAE